MFLKHPPGVSHQSLYLHVTKDSLKQKIYQSDGIFVTSSIKSCHSDNSHCSQWWKFHQNDISISVFTNPCDHISVSIGDRCPMSWDYTSSSRMLFLLPSTVVCLTKTTCCRGCFVCTNMLIATEISMALVSIRIASMLEKYLYCMIYCSDIHFNIISVQSFTVSVTDVAWFYSIMSFRIVEVMKQ